MFNKQMPFFKYHLLDKNNFNFMWITDDNIKVHKINDVPGFYALFGYREEMRKNLIEPEFYIWENYTKESALKEELCLQAIIINYLIDNSVKFRTEYADAYMNWLGTCQSKKLRLTSDCTNCKMHEPNEILLH
ncbi:MAG: hypothetical protein V4440_14190 [Pseudomonadota bacterium]